MKNKTLGIILIVLGVLAVVFDFLAGPLGLSHPGFGWKQISLLVVGILAFAAGLFMTFAKSKK